MLSVSLVKHRSEFSLSATFAAPTPGVIALFGLIASYHAILYAASRQAFPERLLRHNTVKRQSLVFPTFNSSLCRIGMFLFPRDQVALPCDLIDSKAGRRR